MSTVFRRLALLTLHVRGHLRTWINRFSGRSQIKNTSQHEESPEDTFNVAIPPHRTAGLGAFERRQELHRQEQLDRALAERTRHTPTAVADQVVTRAGNRQLQKLSGDQLRVIGLLTSHVIYDINRRLRSRDSLGEARSGPLDWAGYASTRDFVDDAQRIFDLLGEELQFDQPATLFRGVKLVDVGQFAPLTGLLASLSGGFSYIDAGFGFASPSCNIASEFAGDPYESDEPGPSTVFKLTATSGLCIPSSEYRSDGVFSLQFGVDFLPNAIGQVIFPPGTRWTLKASEQASGSPQRILHFEQVA